MVFRRRKPDLSKEAVDRRNLVRQGWSWALFGFALPLLTTSCMFIGGGRRSGKRVLEQVPPDSPLIPVVVIMGVAGLVFLILAGVLGAREEPPPKTRPLVLEE